MQLLVMDRETFLEFVIEGDLIGSEIAVASRQRVLAANLAVVIPQLSQTQIDAVLGNHEAQTFAAGEVIVREGDPSDAFYLITRGKVDVLNEGPSGEIIFLRTLGAGDYFGEIGLVKNIPRTATAQVSEGSEVELIVVDRETFLEIWNESGEAKEGIGRTMCERLLNAGR